MTKVTITPVENEQFQPFTLNIMVESKEELAVLIATFNTSLYNIKEQALNNDNNEKYKSYDLVEKYTKTRGHGLIYDIYCKLTEQFRRRE